MTSNQTLYAICDFNHNYHGCSDSLKSLLIVDKVVVAAYSLFGMFLLTFMIWKRNILAEKARTILPLLFVSFIFKIGYILIISFSFPAVVFLHYVANVTNQSAITINIVTPEQSDKRTKLTEIVLPQTVGQKLKAFYLNYFPSIALALVLLSNNITIFLLALDSTDVTKYHIYHFIQFIVSPIFDLLVATPPLLYTSKLRNNGGKILSKIVQPNPEDPVETSQIIITAIKSLFSIDLFSLFCLDLLASLMILDIIALSVKTEMVVIVKVVSESLAVAINVGFVYRVIQVTAPIAAPLMSKLQENPLVGRGQMKLASGESSIPTVVMELSNVKAP